MIEKIDSGNAINLSTIKALSKEARQNLALAIRKDSELWNAFNGLGGLSVNSSLGRLQGTIYDDHNIVIGAEVDITDVNDNTKTIKTNQYGYFSVDLVSGTYSVVIKYKEKHSDKISVKILAGVTSTLDYDFNEIV
jgi:tRNA/tmRNA/rRNA uracil-C5-methylase (TrmA/RlmC/RlmD family)